MLTDSFPVIPSSQVTELIPTSVISRFYLVTKRLPSAPRSAIQSCFPAPQCLNINPIPPLFRDNKIRTDLRY
jgi:hypothetical protein